VLKALNLIFVGALILVTGSRPVVASPMFDQHFMGCPTIFEPMINLDGEFTSAYSPSELLELQKVEDAAVQALRKMKLSQAEATADIEKWIQVTEEKLARGEHLSVMEHTTLVHLLRTGFLNDLPKGPQISRQVEADLQTSWFRFTGKNLSIEEILKRKLPGSILRISSYREQEFHKAVFRSAENRVNSSRAIRTVQQVLVASMILAIGFTHGGGSLEGQALAGFLTGYTVSAMAEWVTHRYLLHSSKEQLAFLDKKFGPVMTKPFYIHTGVHHSIFPTIKYSAETNQEWNFAIRTDEKHGRILEKRDETFILRGYDPEELHGNEYGMSMNDQEVSDASANTIIVATLASFIFGLDPGGYAAAVLAAPLTAQLTANLHRYLHDPYEEGYARAPLLTKMIMTTGYWRMISQRHYIHHVDPKGSNFSLFLPGPDFFFNSLRHPTLDDLVRMDELKLGY
jgi:hypothetical protein